MKRSPKSYEKSRRICGTLFILPWIIGFLVFFIQPIINSFIYSLSEIKLEGGIQSEFIGLAQYKELLTRDTEFLPALLSSFGNLIGSVPLILAFSLFMAMILNQKFVGRTFARALFFLPVIVASGIVLTLLNEDSYSRDLMSQNVSSTLFGPTGLQTLLIQMNLPNNIVSALVGVVGAVFDMVWQSGVQILLFLSALQSIPKSYYEVAHIECANAWTAFWKITFPMLIPTILIAVIYSIIDSFTHYANPVIKLIKTTYSGNMRYGYASAMAWVYMVLIMLVLGANFLIIGRKAKSIT